jgi:hypothetical protein
MIGFDFPLRPSWIHDVHLLWEPNLPVSDLVSRALRQTLQELGGEKTRRNTLSNLIHYFVRIEGKGNQRRTAEQDVLVAYSCAYPVEALKSVYLARLILLSDVAAAITQYFAQQRHHGDEVTSTAIRRYAADRFGPRKVVTNAATSYLRTLVEFGVLEDAGQLGHYRRKAQLNLKREVFPLCVLAWVEARGTPQIDLEPFIAAAPFFFVNAERFREYWLGYDGALWSIASRLGGERATIRYPDAQALEKALATLLFDSQHNTV